MSLKMRQLVEKEIYTAVIDAALKAGYSLSIDNGDNSGGVEDEDGYYQYEIEDSTDCAAILKAMYQTDEDRLYFTKDGGKIGWVYFVYGNDGWDVISDYTVNLSKLIETGPVNDVVKKYED